MTPGEPNPKAQGVGEEDVVPRHPDPWGVKRAENLLTSLQGVLSARVIVSPVGEITEVHVLTNSTSAPKQMVRNVESALLAHLGLKVDHRKISVAQTADVRPIEALEQSSIKAEALRRPVLFQSMECKNVGSHRVKIHVVLRLATGDEISGDEEVADTPRARLAGVARAATKALDQLLPSGTLELAGVQRITAFDTELMFAGVHVVEGRESSLLIGTAEVRENPERAAALALLDATNRWVQSRRT